MDRKTIMGRAMGRVRLLMRVAIEELSDPQKEALLWWLGFEDGREHSLRFIAKKCGVTNKAIEFRLLHAERALGRRRWKCFLQRALDSIEDL